MGTWEIIPSPMLWNLRELYGKKENKIILKGTGPINHRLIAGATWKPTS